MDNLPSLEPSQELYAEPIRRRRNSATQVENLREKRVLSEKLIYYCSDFDLSIVEWHNEFENIHIFKKRVYKGLGKSSFHYALIRILQFLTSNFQATNGSNGQVKL